MHRMLAKMAMGMALGVGLATAPGSAGAQELRAINTGGPQGAYHSLFCPPIAAALQQAYFTGYACTPSRGTVQNIERTLAAPSMIGFAQLDVFALEASRRPQEFSRLAVIRQDIACEGLWMVTKNDALQNFGAVLGLARRIPFILPAQGSGAAASFDFLRQSDPEGLGRAAPANIRHVSDATAVINAVAQGTDGAVGFFVQFADPQNANIQLMMQNNLRVIPVVSREILRSRVGEQSVYEVRTFTLAGGGFFARPRELTTACTPVAVFAGTPDAVATFGKGGTAADQREMVELIRGIPAARLLPQDDRVARLISGARRLSNQAVEEMSNAADAARRAVQDRLGN
jgi:hypothetical protein